MGRSASTERPLRAILNASESLAHATPFESHAIQVHKTFAVPQASLSS